MPHVDIPADLFQQIQQALPPTGNADQFVHQAVRDKLAGQQQKQEFLRLTALNRGAMEAQGLSEEQVLADFETWRKAQAHDKAM